MEYDSLDEEQGKAGWFSRFFKWGNAQTSALEEKKRQEAQVRRILSKSTPVLPTIGLLFIYAQQKAGIYKHISQINALSVSYTALLNQHDAKQGVFECALDQVIERAMTAYQPTTSYSESSEPPPAACSSTSFGSSQGPTGKQRAKDLQYTYKQQYSTYAKLNLIIQYMVFGEGNHEPGSLKTQLKIALENTFNFNSPWVATYKQALDLTKVAEILELVNITEAPVLQTDPNTEPTQWLGW